MGQETAPAVVEPGVATRAVSPSKLPAPASAQARPKISRLARAALGLGIGTSLSLVLLGLDGWLMSQGVLETHDLPELLTWILPLPTLATLVLALLARGRIAASGGALTGRGLVRGSLWLTGINGVVLLGFALVLLSGAGESYMCGGG